MRTDLRADCANCAGLCCIAPAFARSSDFAIDKPAKQPCPNLRNDFRCGIHTQLRDRGFAGCTVYDCFGAGQKIVQITYQDSKDPRMLDTFPMMRNLHELLWYLDEAKRIAPNNNITTKFDEIEQITLQSPDVIEKTDINELRQEVNKLLTQASKPTGKNLRGKDLIGKSFRNADLKNANLRGALLIGADLSNADLSKADVIGADMRGAILNGADLSETIFLIQAQLDSARGDGATKLPRSLRRPAHWG